MRLPRFGLAGTPKVDYTVPAPLWQQYQRSSVPQQQAYRRDWMAAIKAGKPPSGFTRVSVPPIAIPIQGVSGELSSRPTPVSVSPGITPLSTVRVSPSEVIAPTSPVPPLTHTAAREQALQNLQARMKQATELESIVAGAKARTLAEIQRLRADQIGPYPSQVPSIINPIIEGVYDAAKMQAAYKSDLAQQAAQAQAALAARRARGSRPLNQLNQLQEAESRNRELFNQAYDNFMRKNAADLQQAWSQELPYWVARSRPVV